MPGFEDLTDLTYHRAVEHGTVRIAFDRPDMLNAFRPHTVDELLRVLEHARSSSDVGCVLLTGNGPSEKNGKWAFCTGGDQRIRGRAGYQYETGDRGRCADPRTTGRQGQAGPAAHPRVPAADPLHAEDRDLRGQRLGGRRRAQPARGLRPDPRQRRARAASSRPTPTSARSTAASGRRTSPARSARSSPARSSSSATSTPPTTPHRMGMVNKVVAARRARGRGARVGPQDQRQEPDRAADAEVLLQPDRRRPGRPAAVRRRDHPAGLHDRRGAGGSRPVPREARARTGRRTPGTTETPPCRPRSVG